MRRVSFYTLAALLLAGAAITACTSDDFADEALAPQQGKTYTLSVNATKGADTRTLAESSDGKSLTATWNIDDKVSVYLDGEKVGTLMPDKAEANALLKGTVTGVKEGNELDLVFSSGNYASQDGTLAYIDANCNYAKATVTVTEIVGDAVNTSNAEFVNQQSITKFTFSEEVSKVVIYNGVDEITVTPTAATATLYVAIPATDGEADFTFTATVDGKTYIGEKSATLSNGKFYTATITLSALDEYTDLSAEATANTYMVTEAGKYKFNATVKGNGGLDPLTGTTATAITGIAGVKVLWELYGQGRAIKHDGTSYDISFEDGYVYFSTPDTFTSGDAYVAVYDSEGTILWSWLIWATPEVGTKSHNEKTFMDRNLGAIDVGYCMRGFLYQWGRKDPFSAANGTYEPYPYVPAASEVFNKVSGSTQSMEYTVQHPTTWIGYASGTYTWMSDDLTKNPWRPEIKTIYDPCPAGWRIPTKENISGIEGLPATGLHGDDSGNHDFGNPWTGYYWSASKDGDADGAWAFCNDGRNLNYWGHNQGYAIRPVKEDIDINGVEVGMVIGANGKFYANKAAAEAAGTTAEAMVAYLGTEAEGAEHGLAIALEDASNKLKSFDGVASTFSEWESNHTVKVGTWRLPSVSDFQLMFRGCGSESIYTTDLTEGMGFDYGNFPTKITDAGGNGVQVYYYWCSLGTQYSDTWVYTFSDKVFRCSGKAGDNYIRAVLAF